MDAQTFTIILIIAGVVVVILALAPGANHGDDNE